MFTEKAARGGGESWSLFLEMFRILNLGTHQSKSPWERGKNGGGGGGVKKKKVTKLALEKNFILRDVGMAAVCHIVTKVTRDD